MLVYFCHHLPLSSSLSFPSITALADISIGEIRQVQPIQSIWSKRHLSLSHSTNPPLSFLIFFFFYFILIFSKYLYRTLFTLCSATVRLSDLLHPTTPASPQFFVSTVMIDYPVVPVSVLKHFGVCNELNRRSQSITIEREKNRAKRESTSSEVRGWGDRFSFTLTGQIIFIFFLLLWLYYRAAGRVRCGTRITNELYSTILEITQVIPFSLLPSFSFPCITTRRLILTLCSRALVSFCLDILFLLVS